MKLRAVLQWLVVWAVAIMIIGFPVRISAQRRVTQAIDPSVTVELKDHLPPWAQPDADQGRAPRQTLSHMTLVLSRPAARQTQLDTLVQQQQEPGSPHFHQWLTPAQFGAQFGPDVADVAAVEGWLKQQGFQILRVNQSRMSIEFSGDSNAAEKAFGIEFHLYTVEGRQLISSNRNPSVPSALAPVVRSVIGLSSPNLRPQSRWQVKQHKPDISICSDGSCEHFLTPADFATIYNAQPVYEKGITGTGQTIGIIGRARVYTPDITYYGQVANLTMPVPAVIIPPTGSDPGPALSSTPDCSTNETACEYLDDQIEATLDVQRSGSVAYGSNLELIVSASSATDDGIDIALNYAVDAYGTGTNANILTISFGNCEQNFGQAGVQALDSLYEQAAAQGMTVFNSSGDAGAGGCSSAGQSAPAGNMLAVNGLCVSGYVTCVGGTEFNDGDGTGYWSTTNGTGNGSALSYIPEGAWNDAYSSSSGYTDTGTGGGVSLYIPTPAWQVGIGVPGTQGRYVPDVAFSASGHDGYLTCAAAEGAGCVPDSNGDFTFIAVGGTSASSPSMAGVMALINQAMGSTQGLINPNLYRLATMPTLGIFHDVSVTSSGVTNCTASVPSLCNNSNPGTFELTGGLAGYTVNNGYDAATGWGSVNIANIVTSFAAPSLPETSVTLTSSATNVTVQKTIDLSATVSSMHGSTPTGSVQFTDGINNIGSPVAVAEGVASYPGYIVTTAGVHNLAAIYQGDANNASAESNIVPVTASALPVTFAVVASPTAVYTGQSITVTGTLTPTAGNPVPTGTMQLFNGSQALLSPAAVNASGSTVFNLKLAAAGTYTLTVQYSGDSYYNAATSSAQTITIAAQNQTTTTLTLQPASITAGQSTNLTATVQGPAGQATPTGSVTFVANGISLGTVALTGGIATLSNESVPNTGTYIIQASYSGDVENSGSIAPSQTLTVITPPPTSPSVTATPSSLTVTAPGGSASTVLAVTGFTATQVSFTCTGLPRGGACAFSGDQLQITTTGASTADLRQQHQWNGVAWAILLPAMPGLLVFRRGRMWKTGGMLVLLLVATAFIGCGGSNSSGGSPTNPNETPAGTYSLQIVATAGTQTATTTVTLTVQ